MMKKFGTAQSGFTLIEVAIVLIIVSILLGYTVALLPRQQELKQYRTVKLQMDEVIEAIIGFAQINGRLPCPAGPGDGGVEDINLGIGCNQYGGFVPVNTLGLSGSINADSLLQDPWGNPYRYYVTFNDDMVSSNFTVPGQMRLVGLVDSEANIPPGDTYIDLDGRYLICDDPGAAADDQCADAANQVFGRYSAAAGLGAAEVRYGGAPFVLLSMGKNGNQAATGDELENSGDTATPVAGVPSGMSYVLKDVAGGETTFVRRRTGMAEDFDDVVRWGSPSLLFSRMIKADQLP